MHVKNVDSGVNISRDEILFVGSKTKVLVNEFFSVSVYLVSPQTMDRIYPPERREFLNPECIKEVLNFFDDKLSNSDVWNEITDKFFCRLEECKKKSSKFAPVGVYFSSIPEGVSEEIQNSYGIQIHPKRGIFICPERIQNLVLKVQRDFPNFDNKRGFRFLFAKVYLHELAHAFMDNGEPKSKSEWWERLIEESLANALAYQELRPSKINNVVFKKIVSEQPLEYQGWIQFVYSPFFPFYLKHPSLKTVTSWAIAWKKQKDSLSHVSVSMLLGQPFYAFLPLSNSEWRKLLQLMRCWTYNRRLTLLWSHFWKFTALFVLKNLNY